MEIEPRQGVALSEDARAVTVLLLALPSGEDLPRCTVTGVKPYVEMSPRTSMAGGRKNMRVKRR